MAIDWPLMRLCDQHAQCTELDTVAGGEQGPGAGEAGGVRAATVTLVYFLDAADCFPLLLLCFRCDSPKRGSFEWLLVSTQGSGKELL